MVFDVDWFKCKCFDVRLIRDILLSSNWAYGQERTNTVGVARLCFN